MDRDEALRLLKGGEKGTEEWNRRREARETIPDLRGADLIEANLRRADLHGADLVGANLRRANLIEANLIEANLIEANLIEANLIEANLIGADLIEANLSEADLSEANLGEANLGATNLLGARLRHANFSEASLSGANLDGANLSKAELTNARCAWTVFGCVDLSSVRGLETVDHAGPSTVGTDTLHKSQGKIPEVFLRGCGLSPWEVEIARLYNPSLSCRDVEELLVTKVFQTRTAGPLLIGGVFIS